MERRTDPSVPPASPGGARSAGGSAPCDLELVLLGLVDIFERTAQEYLEIRKVGGDLIPRRNVTSDDLRRQAKRFERWLHNHANVPAIYRSRSADQILLRWIKMDDQALSEMALALALASPERGRLLYIYLAAHMKELQEHGQ